MKYDVVIIGAGAAGLMCAISAGKRGRNVVVIDHRKTIGEKIRISGGGRCNFTNIHASPANYISQNPHFCVSALKRYTQFDFIELVKKYGIKYHEKALGQLFCDDSSRQIIDMLLNECEEAGVKIQSGIKVESVDKDESGLMVYLKGEGSILCDSLVIATGGLSIPQIGATSFGYDIAKKFGLNIIEPKAALVPFMFNANKTVGLSGISLDVVATCGKKSFREAMLFTHKGLSGPAILQISSYWSPSDKVFIDMAPDMDVVKKIKKSRDENPKQDIKTVISTILPKKLAVYFCEEYKIMGKVAELSNSKIEQIASLIKNWEIVPDATEGYKTAEVTLGGVDTAEISSKTFEAKKMPGLYFIGEVLDVTGHLGGYNFQWAWSSGHAAGQFV